MTRFGVAEISDSNITPISRPDFISFDFSLVLVLQHPQSPKKKGPCSDDEQGPLKHLEGLLWQNN